MKEKNGKKVEGGKKKSIGNSIKKTIKKENRG